MRAYLVSKTIGLSFKQYAAMFLRLAVASGLIWLCIYLTVYNSADDIWLLLVDSVITFFIMAGLYITIVFDKSDVAYMVKFISKKIKK